MIFKECYYQIDNIGYTKSKDEIEYSKSCYGSEIYIRKRNGYIGTNESYVIERYLGSKRKGWEPFC